MRGPMTFVMGDAGGCVVLAAVAGGRDSIVRTDELCALTATGVAAIFTLLGEYFDAGSAQSGQHIARAR
jgi:hypothetical protein